MKRETLQELLVEQISDIYDAEHQLLEALPKLVEASTSVDLAEALRTHLVETQEQVSRLEQVFGLVGISPQRKRCRAMAGLVAEGDEASREAEGDLRDLAIIAAAQRVEHYEISAYGTARAIAEHLELDDAADLLHESESEEADADSKLTEVAEMIYATEEDDADDDMTLSDQPGVTAAL
ncbi:MAG: ferritin-like protein [Bryobacterales bacterium]|jgi:ferritin-like metal-binding protein YciE|nr:ferritin-like protein [Bryobacterales bacterium]